MAASARRPDTVPPSRQPAAPRRGGPASAAPRRGDARAPHGAAGRIGWFILRNPLALGSGTAFLVALSFVSANAMWNQTQRHSGAFFATRALPSGWRGDAGTTGAIAPPPRPASPDPTLRRVQTELGRMGLYEGAPDGLPGPGTRRAVAAFQTRNGMPATGDLDGALLASLEGQADIAPRRLDADDRAALPADAGKRGTAKVQAGLKAFGIDGVEVDGIMGARTRAGIREFQAMFGLPETGEPDEALMAKMRETGLTD